MVSELLWSDPSGLEIDPRPNRHRPFLDGPMKELPSDTSHRIPLIKHILSTALDHAGLPEPFCSHAVLGLHDAVELFVQLISEHVGATVSKKAGLLDYWPALEKRLGRAFPKQHAMRRLNQARVGLKHSGIRPSRDEVSELSEQTVAFLEEASLGVLGIAFSELSSVRLVGYEPTASRLSRAEHLGGSGRFGEAAEMCALAFSELMHRFREKSGHEWDYSPFPRLSAATRYSRLSIGHRWAEQNRDLSEHLKKLSAAFAEIEPVLSVLTLGVEYRQFARFRGVTPKIVAMADGSCIVADDTRRPRTNGDIVFAIDFTITAALRLREIDPDPPNGGSELPFESKPVFRVVRPNHRRRTRMNTTGLMMRIGGGFEAWIRHGEELGRMKPGGSEEEVMRYLRECKQREIERGATDAEFFGAQ